MNQFEHYTGTCTVCQRENRRLVDSTGLIHPHDSHGAPCAGSHTRPALCSVRVASTRTSAASLPSHHTLGPIPHQHPAAVTGHAAAAPSTSSAPSAHQSLINALSQTPSNSQNAPPSSSTAPHQGHQISHPTGSSYILKR